MTTMPSHIPATFASAAASNGQFDGASNMRPGGGSEWPRSRPNGATQTFRRPSQAANSSNSRENSTQQATSATSNVYVPPHMSASMQQPAMRSNNSAEYRYTKEQLLNHFKAMGGQSSELGSILTEGWQPGVSTNTSNGTWSRRDDNKENGAGPDICWDGNGLVSPLGLQPLTDDEKTLFSSVNSPLKPPPQNANKDVTQTPGVNGRKSSMSHTPGSGSHAGSLSGSRPGARRRETSDAGSSVNTTASPSTFRSNKEDGSLMSPPASLLRRRTDYKEAASGPNFGERARLDAGLDPNSSLTGFKRTGPLSAGLNGPSSPWAAGPPSASFGSFGSFAIDGSAGQVGTPGERKMGFGSSRAESRFKDIMSRDNTEDTSRNRDKQGLSLLDQLGETSTDSYTAPPWSQGGSVRRTGGQDASILDELDQRVGSAALGGEEHGLESYRSSSEQRRAHDDIGFSALGGEQPYRPPRSQEAQQSFLQAGSTMHETMSPANTNPYHSPEGERHAEENETDDDLQSNPYSGRGPSKSFGQGLDAGDRSQTSSAGAGRFGNMGGLGGLGSIGGSTTWSAAPGPIGTSARSGTGFGGTFQDSLFGDVSSPGAGIFGGPQTGAYGTLGRGSKMGALFPPSGQEQIRDSHSFGDFGQGRGTNSLGFGIPSRDSHSPGHPGHEVLDDLFVGAEAQARSGAPPVASPFAINEIQSQAIRSPPQSQAPIAAPIGSMVTSPPVSASQDASANQMPAAQQRTMVMPDRMRWIYRDPQGITQGPWSGLEMHDWYKAGFFSPELLVKKQEDNDYEPLAQLIRRIGNSREPFLVPQIGIPHGVPKSQPTGPAVAPMGTAAASPSGAAQPPFPSNFPSFGTTLTADQQNALERRKQEEQFLMARQKEHLAQQQSWMRQMQAQGLPPHAMHPQGLHHHSSAHSLQSQPSYGSIASPATYQAPAATMQGQQQQQPPQQPGMQGFYDRPGQQLGGLGSNMAAPRGPDMTSSLDRLSLEASRGSAVGQGVSQQDAQHQEQIASMLQDRARLQQEQQQTGIQGQMSEQESRERLAQYHHLRAQGAQMQLDMNSVTTQQPEPLSFQSEGITADIAEQQPPALPSNKIAVPAPDPSAAPAVTQAPGPSISPLPAPAAQRSKHPVIDTIATDTRSRSQTPVETPTTATLAPWAKETSEGTKGPSLKEIQEAEARKAAQQEEAVAAARRATLAEQERVLAAQAQAQAQTTAGLPSGATWAAPSPTTAGATSAWSKKAAAATPTAGPPKKTLSQIQKEEEAHKNHAAASAASPSPTTTPAGPGGKRYADLASKVASPSAPSVSGAWTTVGAGGKAKVPVGPAASIVPQRTASGGAVVASVPAVKPVAPARANTGNVSSKQTAQDELARWAKTALAKGMNKDVNVDEFIRGLLSFPTDAELISDSVYSNSQILDGNRFAEEFLRRRRFADKGQVPPDGTGNFVTAGATEAGKSGSAAGSAAGGGWSEVARKGEKASEKVAKDREDSSQAFKVVAAKKKGKR